MSHIERVSTQMGEHFSCLISYSFIKRTVYKFLYSLKCSARRCDSYIEGVSYKESLIERGECTSVGRFEIYDLLGKYLPCYYYPYYWTTKLVPAVFLRQYGKCPCGRSLCAAVGRLNS